MPGGGTDGDTLGTRRKILSLTPCSNWMGKSVHDAPTEDVREEGKTLIPSRKIFLLL